MADVAWRLCLYLFELNSQMGHAVTESPVTCPRAGAEQMPLTQLTSVGMRWVDMQ